MRTFLKDWNVKQKCISPYHPQVNSSERVNKDLIRMIATFASQQHNTWDEHLNSFALALRSQINETRKVTPSVIMLGRQLKLPIDRALQGKTNSDYDADAEKMMSEFPDSMNEILNFVKSQMRETQARNKHYYDQKHREFEFEVGDLVWVRNQTKSDAFQGITGKLLQKWIGPYKVLSKKGMTYELNMEKPFVPRRHIVDLKPYVRRQTPSREPWSLKKIQTGLEPDIDPKIQLRPRKQVNYRALAGYKDNSKRK